MHNGLLIAVAAGLTSMIGWGAADFFAKKTIDKIGDVTTLFWAQLLGLIPLFALFLYHPVFPHLQRFDPIFIILFGIVSALSYLPLYNGFGKGKVSLLSPIFASYSVFVVVLAAIFLHAGVSFHQKIAIGLVFAGILIISIDPQEIRKILRNKGGRTNGVPEVLTATIVYSMWLVFFDKFINGKEWLFYLLMIRAVAVATLLAYTEATKKDIIVRHKGMYKYLAAIGLFDVTAFGALTYGFSHTTYVGVVTVLSATFSLPTILLAYLFLKERITKLQIAGAGIIISGVILISIY